MKSKKSRKTQKQAAAMFLEAVSGPVKSRQQVMTEIMAEPGIYSEYQKFPKKLQKEFVEFSMGVRGLKITYDSVFKKIFNPQLHPERLEEFLSLCLNMEVKVLRVLPNETERLTEEASLLIMDILIQLASKSLVNVEIQRLGYLFPGPRCACYSSDLLMRQYVQVREKRRRQNKKFSYKDIREVYTVVLIMQSTKEFHDFPDHYLHYFQPISSTGLKLNLLQNYLLIPLDIFRKKLQNRTIADDMSPLSAGPGKDSRLKFFENKLEAWLLFISSDSPDDILKVISAYPDFQELYREVFQFRYQKKELISMYSEALRILDANTIEYMVKQQKKELRKLTKTLEKKNRLLKTTTRNLETTTKDLENTTKDLENTTKDLENTTRDLEITTKDLEITTKDLENTTRDLESRTKGWETQKQVLESKAKALETENQSLEQEVQRLTALLKAKESHL